MNRLPSLVRAGLFLVAMAPGLCIAAEGSPVPTQLQALVDRALSDNPGIKAQRAKARAALQAPAQAKALPDPTADVEFMNISVNHPNLSDSLTEGSSIGLSQTLPFPGKRDLAAKAAEKEAEVEGAKLAAMEVRLRGEVLAAAYRRVLFGKLLDLNDRQREAWETAASSAAGVYASGKGSQVDLLQAQTALSKTLANRQELVHQMDVIEAKLRSLMGGAELAGTLNGLDLPATQELPPIEGLESGLADSAPVVLEARTGEAVGQAKVDQARRAFRPDFMVGARYRFNDPTMGGGNFVTLQAGITLPFFHRKDRYQPALQESLDRLESARYASEDVLNNARYDLAEAYHSAFMARQINGLYEEGLLIQSRQAYASALASYATGKVDFTTVIATLNDFFTDEATALTSRSDFQEAVARMESVTGHSLEAEAPKGPARETPSERKESQP